MQPQRLADGHQRVETRVLKQHANTSAQAIAALLGEGSTQNAYSTLLGRAKAGSEAQDGTFTSSVRTE